MVSPPEREKFDVSLINKGNEGISLQYAAYLPVIWQQLISPLDSVWRTDEAVQTATKTENGKQRDSFSVQQFDSILIFKVTIQFGDNSSNQTV